MNQQKGNKETVESTDPDDPRKDEEKTSKPKKVRWLTRSMAEDFTRQDVLFTTFKEALIYILFVFSVTMFTIGRRTPSMFYITQALKQQFLLKEFSNANNVLTTFNQLNSQSDFWAYAEGLMVTSLYWETYTKVVESDDAGAPLVDKKVLFENKLLGVPRLRQVRVRNDSCIIHEFFTSLFKSCYAPFTYSAVSHAPFGLANGTAWTYNRGMHTQAEEYTGRLATYGAGGYYQDLGTTQDESRRMIRHMKKNLWTSRGTRVIFLDFSIYNANINVFVVCKLIFECSPLGGVLPSHSFHAIHLVYYTQYWDYVTAAFEIIVYLMTIYYLMEELREICYFKLRYLVQFWTYIDLTIITMSVANFVTNALIIYPKIDGAIKKIEHNPKAYGNLEYLGNMKVLANNFAASLVFFSYIKLFKYLNFNKTMGQLNNTLKRCAFDILGFSIMFFIIFFAFAELGYLVFGSHVKDFNSFGVAMFTLLRTILGDFNYAAIERANRVLAPIYFLSYIFFVFFVLLNMFLAIINDTYADVKTEIAIQPDEMQMIEFLKQGFYKILQKCCCCKVQYKEPEIETNETTQKIREALKKCGFSDLEIEMFFARYNIDPLAEVGEYDVKKIMKELEGQSLAREKMDEDTTLIHVSDFLTQQDRLEEIESNIQVLATKVDNLLTKLESLGNVRRG